MTPPALRDLALRLEAAPSLETEATFAFSLARELRQRSAAWEQREQMARGLLSLLAELAPHPQAALSLTGPEGRLDMLHAPGGVTPLQLSAWRARLQVGDGPLHILDIADLHLACGEPISLPLLLNGASLGSLWLVPPAGEEALSPVARLFAEECAPVLGLAFWREEARRLSRIDPVTGLLTRRSFLERLDVEFERVQRYGGSLAVMRCDLDWPPLQLVDRDTLLFRAARSLEQGLRRSDALGRFGYGEFIFLLPNTPESGARLVAERLRRSVILSHEEAADPVTLSIGLALFDDDPSAAALLERADRAVYRARRLGSNRVESEPRD
jgi:diguanylate cyclase (GGDEF)-like protein